MMTVKLTPYLNMERNARELLSDIGFNKSKSNSFWRDGHEPKQRNKQNHNASR